MNSSLFSFRRLVQWCLCLTSFIPAVPAVAQVYGASAQIIDNSFALPQLSTFPELHTDMPYDCMIAYILMDSLARKATLHQLLEAPSLLSPTGFRFACHMMYAMENYSHSHLKAHFIATMDSARSIHDNRAFPANVYTPLVRAIAIDRREEIGAQFRALLLTHYVLRIRVANVAVGLDSTYGSDYPNPTIGVTCEVVEKIKGIKLPDNCSVEYPAGIRQETSLDNPPCLSFVIPQNCIKFIPKIGEEYYVFLQEAGGRERGYDYLVTPAPGLPEGIPGLLGRSCGLFKIQDGIVDDPYKFWSASPLTPLQFSALLQAKIAEIQSW